MRNNQAFYTALLAVVIVTAATALFLRPPAAKPLEQQPSAPTEHEFTPLQRDPLAVTLVPGANHFNVQKYQREPVVRVWMADKQTIETMPLETYLEGVIAKEMEPSWPLEALMVQAITSRTLTVNAIEAGTIKKLHNADVSTAKEELQAYSRERVNDTVREAVRLTRGQVLMYGDSLVYAIYSACNGQIAATKEESFPVEIPVPTPYFQPVRDNCFWNAPPEQQVWTVKIPAAEVARILGYQGNPADIKILERGPSGRILYIGAGNVKMYGADFRKQVGYDRLKSTLITDMAYDGKNFVFQGNGWGNGVGLCQWGAYTYVQQGWKAADILKYYYVGAHIETLWH